VPPPLVRPAPRRRIATTAWPSNPTSLVALGTSDAGAFHLACSATPDYPSASAASAAASTRSPPYPAGLASAVLNPSSPESPTSGISTLVLRSVVWSCRPLTCPVGVQQALHAGDGRHGTWPRMPLAGAPRAAYRQGEPWGLWRLPACRSVLGFVRQRLSTSIDASASSRPRQGNHVIGVARGGLEGSEVDGHDMIPAEKSRSAGAFSCHTHRTDQRTAAAHIGVGGRKRRWAFPARGGAAGAERRSTMSDTPEPRRGRPPKAASEGRAAPAQGQETEQEKPTGKKRKGR
jgi:hypothetical protein